MSPGMRSAEHGQCNRHKACNVVQEDREQVCAGSCLQIANPMDRRREVVNQATHAHKAHGKYVQSVMLKNGRPGRKLPPRRPRQAQLAAGSRRCTPARAKRTGSNGTDRPGLLALRSVKLALHRGLQGRPQVIAA